MKYRALIFDLDGTLLNTLLDLTNSVNYALESHGYDRLSEEKIRQSLGYGVEKLIEFCTPGGRENPKYESILKMYKSYYAGHSEIKTRPYDGINDLIDRLHLAGIKTAVVSNKQHEAVVTLAKKYFPSIKVAEGERENEGIRRKPYPDMVIHAVNEIGCIMTECAFVGDSEVDIETAKNAGMDSISVDWGFRDRTELLKAGADIIVSTADELYSIAVSRNMK